jgi:hypothetical protein
MAHQSATKARHRIDKGVGKVAELVYVQLMPRKEECLPVVTPSNKECWAILVKHALAICQQVSQLSQRGQAAYTHILLSHLL